MLAKKPLTTARFNEMRHPRSRGGNGTERSVAGGPRRTAGDRKNRQHTVADEFQHFAAESVNRTGNAVEPGIERRDDRGGRMALGHRGESAQVGI